MDMTSLKDDQFGQNFAGGLEMDIVKLQEKNIGTRDVLQNAILVNEGKAHECWRKIRKSVSRSNSLRRGIQSTSAIDTRSRRGNYQTRNQN